MGLNKTVLLMISILIASAIAVSIPSVDGAEKQQEGPLPEELYPDADVILTTDAKGNTLMTFKAYGDYEVNDKHPSIWFTEIITGKDLTIRDLSLVKDSISIVVDDVKLNRLTLFNIDSKAAMNSAISVDFTMVKGEIQTFSLMSIPNNMKQYLGTSYDALPTPIRTAELDFKSGTVNLINPTSLMLSITNLYLNLDYGMSVNKLYTTGENGKYSNVYVTVNGAHIGYMTNIASKIGYLQYDIRSGIIDYFCIGANTEHSINRNLSSMATSYVSGDVDLHVGEFASIGSCIMGAGILNMPLRLCNGTTLASSAVHMVVIDAQGVTICNDTAFLNDRRTSAYHFNNYKIGQNPSISSITDSFNMDGSPVKIYSESGVWESISSTVLTTGSILSLNTDFVIQPDSQFIIPKGVIVYNSDNIVLCGTLEVKGTLVNNSVIQCRPSSEMIGETEGIGYLADYVYYATATNSLKVMSQRDAVVITLKEQCAIEDISATFADGDATVIVTVSGSSRIYGNQFMIALTDLPGVDEFDKRYRLDIKGIDRNTLANSTVDIYLSVDSQVCNAIYVEDAETGEFKVLATAEYASQIKVSAGTYMDFYLYTYVTERPELPQEPKLDTSMSNIDYVLIAAIVAVLVVTLYALVTMKRD